MAEWTPRMADEAGLLTVAEFLALDAVRATSPTVLAGASRTDRRMRTIVVGDRPGRAGRDVLLLVSASSLPSLGEPDRLLAGAAALCVVGDVDEAAVPSVLRAAADRAQVPLVLLRAANGPWSVLAETQHRVIDRAAALDDAARAGVARLVEVLASGGGLDDLLARLAELIDAPVAVTSASMQLLSAANPPRLPSDPFDSWSALTADPAESYSVAIDGPGNDHSRVLWVSAEGREVSPFAAALADGMVSLIPLAGLVAPSRSRRAKQRVDALRRLASSDVGARTGALLRRAGFIPDRKLVVPFVLRSDRHSYLEYEEWSDVAMTLQDQWRRPADSLIVAPSPETGVWGLVAVRSEDDREDAMTALAHVVGDVFESIQLLPPHIVAGPPTAIADLREELIATVQAADAITDRAEWPVRDTWLDVRNVELTRFAFVLRNDPEARRFARRVLRRLEDGPAAKLHLDTLRAYCATLGQKTETARLLHLNRQSLYTRLERIEEVAGVDLDHPETIATFSLALLLSDRSGGTP